MPCTFPNVIDSVKDYQNCVYAVVKEISIEYTRLFANEEENGGQDKSNTNSTLKQGTQQNMYSNFQRELRETRKEKFLIEFNSSSRYMTLRQKLKKAIFRLAVEKYNKEIDHQGLETKTQKEQFKAELYTFL